MRKGQLSNNTAHLREWVRRIHQPLAGGVRGWYNRGESSARWSRAAPRAHLAPCTCPAPRPASSCPRTSTCCRTRRDHGPTRSWAADPRQSSLGRARRARLAGARRSMASVGNGWDVCLTMRHPSRAALALAPLRPPRCDCLGMPRRRCWWSTTNRYLTTRGHRRSDPRMRRRRNARRARPPHRRFMHRATARWPPKTSNATSRRLRVAATARSRLPGGSARRQRADRARIRSATPSASPPTCGPLSHAGCATPIRTRIRRPSRCRRAARRLAQDRTRRVEVAAREAVPAAAAVAAAVLVAAAVAARARPVAARRRQCAAPPPRTACVRVVMLRWVGAPWPPPSASTRSAHRRWIARWPRRG